MKTEGSLSWLKSILNSKNFIFQDSKDLIFSKQPININKILAQNFPFTHSYSVSKKPEDHNLPSDYWYAENSWGKSFYKIYPAMSYGAADSQCKSDGSFLVIPRSEAENDFIASLIPNEDIWIGINDIEQKGGFVAVDGSKISYTNWHPEEPSGTGWEGDVEDGVEIRGWDKGRWNDEKVGRAIKFVCSKSVGN